MPRAIIIYDTLEFIRPLEHRLFQIPEIILADDARALVKFAVETWISSVLFNHGLITDRDFKADYRKFPRDVVACLDEHSEEWSRFISRQIRIPQEFYVLQARLSVYRGELWLVYDF